MNSLLTFVIGVLLGYGLGKAVGIERMAELIPVEEPEPFLVDQRENASNQ